MLPLDTIAALLRKHGHEKWAEQMRSLGAREELRLEGFWQDLGAASVWSPEGWLAGLRLDDAEDDRRLRQAFFQVADEMMLRGVDSADSDAWLRRFREDSKRRDA